MSWYYIYILKSVTTGDYYTGFTNNLRKRLWQHNNGKSPYTKGRGPYELIYYEASRNEDDERSRELFLKTGMGKRFVRNRIRRFLSLTG
jgi:putative endonuclease